MAQPPVLTGQDIAEADGAVTMLLEQALARVLGRAQRPAGIS